MRSFYTLQEAFCSVHLVDVLLWSSRPGLENNVSQWMVCVYLTHSCYAQFVRLLRSVPGTARKIKLSIKDYFSKCDQIRSLLRIWSPSLKKSLMKNLIFCAVWVYFIFIVKEDRLIKANQDIWLVNCHTCG